MMKRKETGVGDQGEVLQLVPARMLNEFTYCPRLCYIEWVQSEFEDSADTIEGRYHHRRVESRKGSVSEDAFERFHTSSVFLSGEETGAVAKIDLLEGEEGRVVPVDYKRGRVPRVLENAYEPERVQLCVQGLLLREKGYRCDEGVLYFAESRRRVTVPFDEELVARTRQLLVELREMVELGEIPPPLVDSPKCPRCSLVGICLPDEVN